jgi:hypothetical protein
MKQNWSKNNIIIKMIDGFLDLLLKLHQIVQIALYLILIVSYKRRINVGGGRRMFKFR